MVHKKLNKKLLLWTLAVLVVAGAGTHFLHHWQIKRQAKNQYALAQEAKAQGRPDQAATDWGRSWVFAPDDIDALAEYGLLLDRMTARTPKESRRVMEVLEQALERAPARQDLRRALAVRALDLSLYSKARTH